jgi:hypothetical protein
LKKRSKKLFKLGRAGFTATGSKLKKFLRRFFQKAATFWFLLPRCQNGLVLLDMLQLLLKIIGEHMAAVAGGDKKQGLALRRAQHRLDRRDSGRADRLRR